MHWESILAIVILLLLVFLFVFCLFKAWRSRTYTETGDLRGVKPVPFLNEDAFCGQWYEHGRVDSSFEPEDMTNVSAHYSKNEDGTIRVVNTGFIEGEKKQQKGFAFKTPTHGVLQVSFFPFVNAPLVVLDAEIDTQTGRYSSLVLGSPSRDYLWAMSRSSKCNQKLLDHTVQLAAKNKYDKETLKRFHVVSHK